ncbi:hypothetical protein AB9P05_14495 [Roseivirga sp. BDSF3-8]|uniref:hypothetical protein n=1 Tax=Roseivirga sp. BDSF3-8 TaxID=3241598 RepID=UPI003531EAFA
MKQKKRSVAMKHEPIDELFRTRLEHQETPPGAGNWDKLNSMLDASEGKEKKNRKGIFWWSAAAIAAAVTLLVVFAGNEQTGTDQDRYVADNTEKPTAAGDEIASESANSNGVTEPPVNSTGDILVAHTDTKAIEAQDEGISPPEESLTSPGRGNLAQSKSQTLQTNGHQPTKPDNTSQALAAVENTALNAKAEDLAAIDVKNIAPDVTAREKDAIDLPAVPDIEMETLVASLDEQSKSTITISYVDSPDDETSGKKRFSMKKLIGLAKEIKEGEVGIGDLRQAKDNIIAGQFSRTSD